MAATAAPITTKAYLSAIEYGKGEVRVTKVIKDAPVEGSSSLQEIKAQVLLQGDFVPSFVNADNSLVVPTDTCKNTIYFLAKDHLNDDLESFGVVLGRHFLKEYSHVSRVKISLEQVTWTRLVLADGKPHKHSFQQGRLRRLCTVEATRDLLKVTGGFAGLRILKTTGSGFSDFHQCKLTTLLPVDDRILSTDVLAQWSFCPKAANGGSIGYSRVFDQIHAATLDIFATTYSKSVQATMWEIGRLVIDSIPTVSHLSLELPNLHNWYYDLARFGLDNDVKSRTQIFTPTDEPRGVIRCTISRSLTSKL